MLISRKYGVEHCKNIIVILVLLSSNSAMAYTADTLATMFSNLNNSLGSVYQMLIGICYLTGLSLVASAIYKLKKFGERTAFMHNSKGILAPALLMFIGTALMWAPRFLEVMNNTLFGYAAVQSTLSWSSSGTGVDWVDTMAPMIETVQIIGMIAFIRGMLLVSRLGAEQVQPGIVSKGMIHIIGGVLAINITGTMDVLTNTFGT